MAAVLARDYQRAQHSLPGWCLGLVRVLQSVLRQWHLFAQAQEVHRDQLRLTPETPALTSSSFAAQSCHEEPSQNQPHCSHGITQPGSVFLVILCCSAPQMCPDTHGQDISREFIQIIRELLGSHRFQRSHPAIPPCPALPIADVGLVGLSEFFHSQLINFKSVRLFF